MSVQENNKIDLIDVPNLNENVEIKQLVHIIRGKQVMLDFDLAFLYQVETGALNRAVKRNIDRFPEDFCFQLTKEEFENLKCQIGIASSGTHGGRRSPPYAFTEQGISMLASTLHSDVAVQMSIKIMRSFVEMRHFITNNSLLFERISNVELKQLEFQKETNERFDKVFNYINEHADHMQSIFFDGQIYDAFSLLTSIIQKAKKNIKLIDGYVDVNTLNILSKKNKDVHVICYTHKSTKLTVQDLKTFNAQYPFLEVKHTNAFHDRFLILDNKTAYHIGASLKDAGKKCFALTLLTDEELVKSLLNKINS